MPSRRARKFSRFAGERPRDDAPNAVGVAMPPPDSANLVKPFRGHHVLMRRDLQNGIRRGVNDRLACFTMFSTKLFEDLRAALRVVANELGFCLLLDGFD